MNSVYQASLTFVGQNVGAKKYDRINKVQGVCLVLVTIIGLVFGVTTYCLGEPLLSIYLPNDPEAIPYGIIRMSYIALPYFLCGMMEVMVGGQRGMGMSFIPMINALLGSLAYSESFGYRQYSRLTRRCSRCIFRTPSHG